MRNIEEIFTTKPWQQICEEELSDVKHVPTMLAHEEQQLYYWLTKHFTEDLGEVVELGSYVGGGAARLAAGLQDTGKLARVFAYDRFLSDEATKKSILYPQGVKPFEGGDLLPLAKELLTPWIDRMVLRRGNIVEKTWNGAPIEVLVMDASKSVDSMDQMAETFFPHLIAGKSVIVQQDYYHWKLPWIAVQMRRMRKWFKPLMYCPQDTVIFLNTKQIDAEAIKAGRVGGMSDAEMIACLRRVNSQGLLWHKAFRIRQMIRAVTASPEVRVAWKMKQAK